MERMMTVGEVAETLRISAYTVRRWLGEGILPGVKLEFGWRVLESDLEAFIQQRRRKPAIQGETNPEN